jgi:membrane-bound inhibitor of C-type lysozyme
MNMKIAEAQGYSKQKALETTGFDVDIERLKNATQSWKKAGAPLSGKKLTEFLEAYIKDNKVYGAYVVVEAASDDTRERPYKVINEATKGKRKATTTYQVKEAELKVKYHNTKDEEGNDIEVPEVTVVSSGKVEGRATKKDQAVKLMKDLIKQNKKDYVIEIVKEITEGQKFAAYGEYTPSKSAELGKFLFAIAD